MFARGFVAKRCSMFCVHVRTLVRTLVLTYSYTLVRTCVRMYVRTYIVCNVALFVRTYAQLDIANVRTLSGTATMSERGGFGHN